MRRATVSMERATGFRFSTAPPRRSIGAGGGSGGGTIGGRLAAAAASNGGTAGPGPSEAEPAGGSQEPWAPLPAAGPGGG